MLYWLWSADGVGHPLTLVGFNDIHHAVAAGSALRDVWAETTMLYTRLDARPVGAGSIHILPFDFARQLTTFRVRGPATDAG
ncbi:MAG: hypothetical protein M3063_05325, partial [Actinomycetota bacterium]|nr:hypothetical protein [Actinomycetota bacterium]